MIDAVQEALAGLSGAVFTHLNPPHLGGHPPVLSSQQNLGICVSGPAPRVTHHSWVQLQAGSIGNAASAVVGAA